MDAQTLTKQIADAHADIELKLEELRTQKTAINEQIKILLEQQQQLPVLRTKRAPRAKKGNGASAAVATASPSTSNARA